MSEPIFIADRAMMLALGKRLASLVKPGDVVYLSGELGAGKTTLAQGFLRSFGITGSIKSPTFTLVEGYHVNTLDLFHFDFYRLKSPDELIEIGLSDYLNEHAICLIEWPEKALNYLPKASYYCTIQRVESGRGRWVTLE